jgi:hypothetical protein
MTKLLKRSNDLPVAFSWPQNPGTSAGAPIDAPPQVPTWGSTNSTSNQSGKQRDPNQPDYRYQIHQKCIYERSLPGEAYITAHVQRLQQGYYDSPQIHEDTIDDVRFVAVNFVFHPSKALSNRFRSAVIRISLLDEADYGDSLSSLALEKRRVMDGAGGGKAVSGRKPRFLRHAPHLMFGAVSPENLQWNFNLAGSLGVSQTPVSASLSPSGGVVGKYKVYQMMRIQGSTRTLKGHHHNDDVEDGQVVWSLEENDLQRSGLPREFTFVTLLQKPEGTNVLFDVEIEPCIANRWGHYPQWWLRVARYLPLHKNYLDLDEEIGQKFEPCRDARGYNFAELASRFDDFVIMPGMTWSSKVRMIYLAFFDEESLT